MKTTTLKVLSVLETVFIKGKLWSVIAQVQRVKHTITGDYNNFLR